MQTVNNVKKASLKPIIEARVSPDGAKFVTDGAAAYTQMIPAAKHQAGSHNEETRDKKAKKLSNQTIEGAFSLFKRGLVGLYHKLSGDHLDRYLGEFCWRFNRHGTQVWMFQMALENLGKNKPMTYKELTKF